MIGVFSFLKICSVKSQFYQISYIIQIYNISINTYDIIELTIKIILNISLLIIKLIISNN